MLGDGAPLLCASCAAVICVILGEAGKSPTLNYSSSSRLPLSPCSDRERLIYCRGMGALLRREAEASQALYMRVGIDDQTEVPR